MASVIDSGNGRWIIQFFAGGRRRRSLRASNLGDCETQQSLRKKIEHLEEAAHRGTKLKKDVLAWLQRLDPQTRQRFVDAGLLVGPLAEAALAGVHASAQSGPPTLRSFLDGYVASRTDVKPLTIRHLKDVRRRLLEWFDLQDPERLLRNVTPADADAWRAWLKAPKPNGKGLSENTVRRWCGRAKQFFRAAIRARLVKENPFQDHKVAVQANKERMFYVTRAVAEKVMKACGKLPSGKPREHAEQWRLALALARYAGLRCPSELEPLTWGDIHWDSGRMRIRSPKTEHHEGHAERMVPLFPEVREALRKALDEAVEAGRGTGPDDSVVVICGESGANLRTHMLRIVEQAKVKPWPKLFQNMRSTRETELADYFPEHVVTAWLGNSQPVARKHYFQTTDEHFARALTVATGGRAARALHSQPSDADSCDSIQSNPSFPRENEGLQIIATPCDTSMPPVGLEPTT